MFDWRAGRTANASAEGGRPFKFHRDKILKQGLKSSVIVLL